MTLRRRSKHQRKITTIPKGPARNVKLMHVAEVNTRCVNQPQVSPCPDYERLRCLFCVLASATGRIGFGKTNLAPLHGGTANFSSDSNVTLAWE